MAPRADNPTRTVVVAGHGMVGHKLLQLVTDADTTSSVELVTFCEESRPAYDRVKLSSLFAGTTPEELSLVEPGFLERDGLTVHIGDAVVAIDRDAHEVTSRQGRVVRYDELVLATGSVPFVPPVPGRELAGCFVYRTIDDLDAIRAYAAHCRVGAVVGGGLLGLEAANALRMLGLETHVVEFADTLMPTQLDPGGGAMLRRHVEDLGVVVHTSMRTREIVADRHGAARAMRFAPPDGAPADTPTASYGSTSWSFPPVSDPATTWPAAPAWPSANEVASWSTRPAAPRIRTSSPSASAPWPPSGSRAWCRPGTRWRRW